MKTFRRVLFFDTPIGANINQAPFWLLWLTWPGLILASGILISYSTGYPTNALIDFITIAQFPLLAYYLTRKDFQLKYTLQIHALFVFLYLLTVLADLFFPTLKDLISITPRGVDAGRHSFLSTEPSFFAELVVTTLIIIFFQRKYLVLFLSLLIFYGLSLSKTILQQLSVFFAIYFLMSMVFANRKFTVSAGVLRVGYVGATFIALALLVHPWVKELGSLLHSEWNSWRLASNVIAVNIAEVNPTPEYRQAVVEGSYGYVSWMKFAVWSLHPFIVLKFGILTFGLYLCVISITVIKRGVYVVDPFLATLIIYSILCLVMFSPKWNVTQQYLLFWGLSIAKKRY